MEVSSYWVALPKSYTGNPATLERGELPPPTAVICSSSQTPGVAETHSGFSQSSSRYREAEGDEKESSEKGDERGDGDGDGFDTESNDDTGPPEAPSHGRGSVGDPRITFEIISYLPSINNNNGRKFVQTLTTQGALTIKTTSVNSQTYERRIQFQQLKFGADPPGISTGYKQSSVRVIVNSNSQTSISNDIKPWSPPACYNNTFRISEHDSFGSVQWTFESDDPFEQKNGIKMYGDSEILPTVTFEFFGTPLPERADIEITSCWSLIPDRRPSPKRSNWFRGILRKFCRSSNDGTQTPAYSNLCQIMALEIIPSTLPPHSHYVAHLYPVREISGYFHLPRENIDVLHYSGASVVVKPDLSTTTTAIRL